MKKIFEEFDKDGALRNEVIMEINSNEEEAKAQVDQKINQLYIYHLEKDIDLLYDLFNNLPSNCFLANYILSMLFNYYIDNLDMLIDNGQFYCIYILIDLFINNNVFKEKTELQNNKFAKQTIKLLAINSEPGSFLEIACLRYIKYITSVKSDTNNDLIKNIVDGNYLRKYKKEVIKLGIGK